MLQSWDFTDIAPLQYGDPENPVMNVSIPNVVRKKVSISNLGLVRCTGLISTFQLGGAL